MPMEADTPAVEVSAEDFARVEESVRLAKPVSERSAQRYYHRIRASIQAYVGKKSHAAEKPAQYLLLVPDVFILLWRLTVDSRVSAANKALLAGAIAYYILPFDLLPEAILGPIGYLDDLIVGVYTLNKVVADTNPDILREHWSGSEDVFGMLRRVLAAADSLLGRDFLRKVKKIFK
ncbi:MAG TPA: YkvA family protein [Thermoanaerobaculia bacterium]|nr:YkvA family protein [Thermoanaerobaculia bacterium]